MKEIAEKILFYLRRLDNCSEEERAELEMLRDHFTRQLVNSLPLFLSCEVNNMDELTIIEWSPIRK